MQEPPDCDAIGVPGHLHTGDRHAESFPDAAERLFRRVAPEIDLSGEIPVHAFGSVNSSVNRGRFCQSPEDALYSSGTANHYFSHGIIGLPVGGIDGMVIQHPQVASKRYEVRVVHTPMKCIYPHSEIKVFENGRELSEIRGREVKLLLKKLLSERSSVVRLPSERG